MGYSPPHYNRRRTDSNPRALTMYRIPDRRKKQPSAVPEDVVEDDGPNRLLLILVAVVFALIASGVFR
jgi:hypothetical protein